MKCPKCGKEIAEGKLYCESCGGEILIVPEFEPEIENIISDALSDVATKMGQVPGTSPSAEDSEQGTGKMHEMKFKQRFKRLFKKKLWISLVVVSFFMLGLCGVLQLVGYYSPGGQSQKAHLHYSKGAYDQAVACAARAAQLSPYDSENMAFYAECTYAAGNYKDAVTLYQRAIELDPSNKEAYKQLINCYLGVFDYQSINELLMSCEDPELLSEYQDYQAKTPEFDYKSGVYEEKISVKLLSGSGGTIYYTLDGSTPDENSLQYTAPITLEAGKTTVRAFYQNKYGVKSEVVIETYQINLTAPDAPYADPGSGNYSEPCAITVMSAENTSVYYTTDGSIPTMDSALYTGPIPMPLGSSTFKFVAFSTSGVGGGVTERRYDLSLDAAFDTEGALKVLLASLVRHGILLDEEGALDGKIGHNSYTYKFVFKLDNNAYYLFREYYEDVVGLSGATGNDYVVDIMTGECQKAMLQEDNTYKLLDISASLEAASEEDSVTE